MEAINVNPLFPHILILVSIKTGIPCLYNTKTNRVIISNVSKKNYRWVNVYDINNERHTVSLGRMLLMLTQPMEDYSNMQCDHIDRNSLNDRLDNLRWVTPSLNGLNRNKANNRIKHGKIIILFDNHDVVIYDHATGKDFFINYGTLYTLANANQGTHYSKKYQCSVYWLDKFFEGE